MFPFHFSQKESPSSLLLTTLPLTYSRVAYRFLLISPRPDPKPTQHKLALQPYHVACTNMQADEQISFRWYASRHMSESTKKTKNKATTKGLVRTPTVCVIIILEGWYFSFLD